MILIYAWNEIKGINWNLFTESCVNLMTEVCIDYIDTDVDTAQLTQQEALIKSSKLARKGMKILWKQCQKVIMT